MVYTLGMVFTVKLGGWLDGLWWMVVVVLEKAYHHLNGSLSAQLNSTQLKLGSGPPVSQSVISLSMVLSTGQVHAARNQEEEAASIRTGTIFINYCTTKENEETPAISPVKELMQ